MPTLDELKAHLAQKAAATEPAVPKLSDLTDYFKQKEDESNQFVTDTFMRSLNSDMDRRSGVAFLAAKLNQPEELIDAGYDEIKESWGGSQFNAGAWRKDNPEMAAFLTANPNRADFVVADERMSRARKAYRGIVGEGSALETVVGGTLNLSDEDKASLPWWARAASNIASFGMPAEGAPPSAMKEVLSWMGVGHGNYKPTMDTDLKKLGQATGDVPMDKIAYMDDERAKELRALKGFDRFRIPFAVFQDARANNEMSELGVSIGMALMRGKDTTLYEQKLKDLSQKAMPRYYGGGEFEFMIQDAMGIAAPQVDMIKAGGTAAVVTGSLVAAGTYAVTRNARLASKLGWKVGSFAGKAGATYESFLLETGGAFLEYRNMKLPDGTNVNPKVAFGTALFYGAFAALVETASFKYDMKSMGPFGEALYLGEGRKFFFKLMADKTFTSLALKAAANHAARSGTEGAEESVQQLGQDFFGWLNRSISAGTPQYVDFRGAVENALEVGEKALIGTALTGLPMTGGVVGIQGLYLKEDVRAQQRQKDAVALAVEVLRRDASIKGLRQVDAILDTSDSLTAKTSPATSAQVVEEVTSSTGETVKDFYIDTTQAKILFQNDEDLLNPDEIAKAEALGQKVEVPVAKVLEAAQRDPSKKAEFKKHSNVRPSYSSRVELVDDETSAMTEAKAFSKMLEEAQKVQEEKGTDEAIKYLQVQSDAEKRLVDVVEEQLKAAGIYNAKEAPKVIALQRGFIRAMATRMNIDADVLFRDYVIRAHKAMGIPEEGDKVLQETGKRGFTQRIGNLFNVGLLKDANRSTFLHETGHIFLEMLSDFSQQEGVPDAVKEDVGRIAEFLGASDLNNLTTEQHEKFARAFEAYLREGKAPSRNLERAFERYRIWLTRIYKKFRALNVELNPEITGLFDRMLATDKEIANVQTRLKMEPMSIAEATEAGMSAADYEAYIKNYEETVGLAKKTLLQRIAKHRLQEQEQWWKDEEKALREKYEKEFEELPARRAQKFLRGTLVDEDGTAVNLGASQLQHDAVVDAVGEKRASKFDTTDAEGGIHPDMIAGMFRFDTGEDMLQAIDQLPDKGQYAKQKAALDMLEKHPDILADRAEVRSIVEDQLATDKSIFSLVKEWSAFRKKAGKKEREVDNRTLKRVVEILVQDQNIFGLNPHRAIQGAVSAARKAAVAQAKKEWVDAADFKRQQILNMHLYTALRNVQGERWQFAKLTKELAGLNARRRLGKASQVYLDGVDFVLEALGLRKATPQNDAQATLPHVIGQLEQHGVTVGFDPTVIQDILRNKRGWKTLNVSQMREVMKYLKNVQAAARERTTFMLEQKRLELEDAAQQVQVQAEAALKDLGRLSSSKNAETTSKKLKRFTSGLTGSLTRPETILMWAAGRSRDSILYKGVIRPLQMAKYMKHDLLREAIKPIVDAFSKVPTGIHSRFMEDVDGDKLFPNHIASMAPPTKRFELLMIVLNCGNVENMRILMAGRQITREQLQVAIDMLTKEEMDWIQSIWSVSDKPLEKASGKTLWQLSMELDERTSGVSAPKIQPQRIVTRHGTYEGGFFPLAFDVRVTRKELVARDTIDPYSPNVVDVVDNHYTRSGTNSVYMKGRTSRLSDVVALDVGIIYAHLSQVAHDIAFREPLLNAATLLMNKNVGETLIRHLGLERYQIILTWLQDIGRPSGVEAVRHVREMTNILTTLRSNLGPAILGFKIPIALGDMSNLGVALVIAGVRTKHLTSAIFDCITNAHVNYQMALKKSGELRALVEHGAAEFHREMNRLTKSGFLANVLGKVGPLAWVKDHAFIFQEWSTKGTATPIWLAKYRQALEENGNNEEDAVDQANQALRKVFPTRSVVDHSELMRDTRFWGRSILFASFFNKIFDASHDIVQPIYGSADPKDRKILSSRTAARVGKLMALYFTYNVMNELLVGRGPEAGDGDTESERWATWFARKMITAGINTLPMGGEISGVIESTVLHRSPSIRASPLIGFFEIFGKVGKLLWSKKDVDWDKMLIVLWQMFGFASGAPSYPVSINMEGIIQNIEDPPDNLNEYPNRIIFGGRKSQPVTPLNPVPRR